MRCIYLLSDDIDPEIQGFRIHHDPLGKYLPPHVTVVFPFALGISDENLKDHIQGIVSNLLPIQAQLGEVVGSEDGYIYFPILEGSHKISALHDNLYSGPLERVLLDRLYTPHVTIGRDQPGQAASILKAARSLVTETNLTLTQIVLERIGDQGESVPIAHYDLSRRLA